MNYFNSSLVVGIIIMSLFCIYLQLVFKNQLAVITTKISKVTAKVSKGIIFLEFYNYRIY